MRAWRMNDRRLGWAGIPIALVAGLMLAACGADGASETDQTEVPVVIDDLSVIADGRLAPIQSVQLTFDSGGEIREVLVKEGDRVAAGQVLVRLGNREQALAAVTAAQLELLSAEQGLESIHEQAGTQSAQA